MLSNSKQNQPRQSQISLKSIKFQEQYAYDFDDMLPLIGEFGLFQKYLFVLMIPFMFFAAFVYLNQIFLTLVPAQYWCYVPQLVNMPINEARELSIPKEGNGYNKCKMYDVNYTDVLERNLTSNDSWPVTNCKYKYIYKFTDVPYPTVATEFNWVCEHDKFPTYAFMSFFLGAIFGSMLYGYLADHIGRLPSLVSANFLGCVGGICTSLSNNFMQFAISRFLVGMAYDSCYTLYYILLLEYVGPSHRTLIANMSIGLFYTPASCLVPWIAYYIGNWRTFSFVTSVPMTLAVFVQCIVPESARWLVSMGQIDEACKKLENIAKINNRSIPPTTLEKFRLCCQQYHSEEMQNRDNSIFKLYRFPRLLVFTLLLVITWMLMMLVYDGHVRALSNIDIDFFITFTFASLTELPSAVFLVLTLDRCGRRCCAFLQMTACGALTIYAANMVDKYQMAICAIAGRFFANNCYNIGLQYAAEILPTVIRAQGLAFIHIMGYMAAILSPFIVYLGFVDRALPFFILGILGIIGGLLALLLPETLNEDLPQTLADGNKFGKDQPCCYTPCCGFNDSNRRSSKRGSKRYWHTGASLREFMSASLRSRQLCRKAFRTSLRTDLSKKAHGTTHESDEDLQGENENIESSQAYK